MQNDNPTHRELVNEMHGLIDLAEVLAPEGEGLDLTDREYTLENLVLLRRISASMYTAIQAINRGFAAAWESQYPGETIDMDDKHWWVGVSNRSPKYQKGMEEKFGAWLKEQDPDRIVNLVPARTIRVSHMATKERDTFLDEGKGDGPPTIKSKPIK